MAQQPILVATELDESGDEAVRQAAAWAEKTDSPLVVVNAVSNLLSSVVSAKGAEPFIQAAVAKLVGKAEVTVRVRTGSAAAAIIAEAEKSKARLLVIGEGDTGALMTAVIGSTTERVVRHAPCPVLVARPSPAAGPVLGATDFSDGALPALAAAVAAAAQRQVGLAVMHSVHIPSSPLSIFGPAVFDAPSVPGLIEERKQVAKTMLDSALERLGVTEGRSFVTDGAPARAIVRQAKELGASLVVVGSQGKTGFARIGLGSEAEAVVRAAPCSVLIARPGSGEASSEALVDEAVAVASRLPPFRIG